MKRKLWIVFTVLLLSTTALLAVATRTWADFAHSSAVPLSYSWEPCSAVKPHLATSPDGHQLAAVWVQETQYNGSCRAGGFGAMRWATEESSYDGWASPFQVFLNAYSTACVNHIDVAVDENNVAHVVATIQEPCDLEETTSTSLHYRACELSGGEATCGEDVTLASEDPQSTGFYLLEAAIAVSADGAPFVVYGRRQIESPLSSQVHAARPDGDAWVTFPLSNDVKAYRPALTWALASNGTGYVHIVWETHDTPTLASWTNGRVQYLRCTETGGCGNVRTFLAAGVYPRPAVAASGAPYDRVLIAWNRFDTLNGTAPCEEFGLYYYRSDDNGNSFSNSNIREVLSERIIDSILYGEATYKSAGTREGGEGGEEYFSYLRPAAAMDSAGLPVVAWQIPGNTYPYSDTYVITTTRVITWKTTEGLNWQTEDRWLFGESESTNHYLNPDLALASRDYDPHGEHVVYMRQEWYNAIGGEGYPVYRVAYSYNGTRYEAPTPSPTADENLPPTPTATIPPSPYQSPNTIYLPVVMRART